MRTGRCRGDIDNLRAAFDWARETANNELLIALAGAAAWLLGAIGLNVESVRLCEEALTLVDPATPPAFEARLCMALLHRSHPRANLVDRAARERSLALFRQLEDRRGLFDALRSQCLATAIAGDLETCERSLQEMTSIYDTRWPPAAHWELLTARIYHCAYNGRMQSAIDLCLEALRIAESIGDEGKIRTMLVYLEQGAQGVGRYDEAVTRGRELLQRVRGDPFSNSTEIAMGNLAMSLLELGRLDEAIELAREVLPLKVRNGTLWVTLDMYAHIALARGNPPAAARILGRADESHTLHGGRRQFNEKRQREIVVSGLQQVFPAEELARLMEEGEELSDEAAARLALD